MRKEIRQAGIGKLSNRMRTNIGYNFPMPDKDQEIETSHIVSAKLIFAKACDLYESHDVLLNFGDNPTISVVTAPNGFGKTTMFSLIDSLCQGVHYSEDYGDSLQNGDMSARKDFDAITDPLVDIPFSLFSCVFELSTDNKKPLWCMVSIFKGVLSDNKEDYLQKKSQANGLPSFFKPDFSRSSLRVSAKIAKSKEELSQLDMLRDAFHYQIDESGNPMFPIQIQGRFLRPHLLRDLLCPRRLFGVPSKCVPITHFDSANRLPSKDTDMLFWQSLSNVLKWGHFDRETQKLILFRANPEVPYLKYFEDALMYEFRQRGPLERVFDQISRTLRSFSSSPFDGESFSANLLFSMIFSLYERNSKLDEKGFLSLLFSIKNEISWFLPAYDRLLLGFGFEDESISSTNKKKNDFFKQVCTSLYEGLSNRTTIQNCVDIFTKIQKKHTYGCGLPFRLWTPLVSFAELSPTKVFEQPEAEPRSPANHSAYFISGTPGELFIIFLNLAGQIGLITKQIEMIMADQQCLVSFDWGSEDRCFGLLKRGSGIDKRFVPRKSLSSGELSIFRILFGATHVPSLELSERNAMLLRGRLPDPPCRPSEPSLSFVDEPENSLHVLWQERIIDALQGLSAISSTQIILATHSPFIISSHADLCAEVKS